MKLGAQYGYWTGEPRQDVISVGIEAENLGYDSLWTGESYSSDAFTPLCWVGAHTNKIKLATGIAQLGARTPATLAMQAMKDAKPLAVLNQVAKISQEGQH